VACWGELKKAVHATSGRVVQTYSSVHLVRVVGGEHRVWLGDDFHLGRSGTTLESGLGVDVALPGGKTMLYGNLTRQYRISDEGHQGWRLNLGVRIGF